jgi:hypothetical protein
MMREAFDHIRDRQQRVRAVVDSVRAERRGEPRAEIAAELARRLAAAGVPELPEDVELKAGLIPDLPRTLLGMGAALVRVVTGRPGPAGLRRDSRHLDGVIWISVRVSDEPLSQRTLRIYSATLPGSADAMYIGRIVALPGDEVAVFLGSTFIGLLPSEPAQVVHPVAAETDAADLQLKVKGRIAGADGARTLEVSLP